MQTVQQVIAQTNERRKARAAERYKQAAERAAALLNSDAFLRLPEVLAVVGVRKTTLWSGIKRGVSPAGVKVSDRCTAWPAGTIRELISRTAAAAKEAM